jgi:putative serine protease PepD
MAQSGDMTENFPGDASGPPGGEPEPLGQHVEPDTGQPTQQGGGASSWQRPTESAMADSGPDAIATSAEDGPDESPAPAGTNVDESPATAATGSDDFSAHRESPGGAPSGPVPVAQVPSGPVPLAQVPPSPWVPYGSQRGYQQSQQQPVFGYPPVPPTGSVTSPFLFAGEQPVARPKRRASGLVVGVAALALVVGGLAGGLGGYLASGGGGDAGLSSLAQSLPASQTANAPAGSVQSVANSVLPVVVTIAAEFQTQGNVSGDTGSGVVISSGGDILTNNHVIAGAATGGHLQVIFANGRTVDATIVGRDPTTDIAVIRAQGVSGLPIAQFGRSDDLVVGQNVVAIGAPFELSGTVTSGIISSLHRPTAAGDGSAASQTTVLDAIQTDAPINPGNSGGPLVDMQGRVIGINSAIYSPNTGNPQAQGGNVGIGFAIPINQARRTADEIVRTGHATQTVLGVQVEDNTPNQNGQPSILPNGALLTQVTPGGPADKAGLKAGSIVVKADGRLVTSSDGLVAAVHAAAPGDRMLLTLSNGTTVTVTLAGQIVHPS